MCAQDMELASRPASVTTHSGNALIYKQFDWVRKSNVLYGRELFAALRLIEFSRGRLSTETMRSIRSASRSDAVAGRRASLNTKVLSDLTGLRIATISRRHAAAMIRLRQKPDLDASASKVIKKVSKL